MKTSSSSGCGISCRLIFALCLVFFIGASSTAGIEEAIVQSVSGKVTVENLDGKTRDAALGMIIESGEVIETGDNGSARILMWDESVLEIKQDTRLAIGDSRTNQSGVISVLLYIGQLYAKITPGPSKEDKFEIETPTAVAGIRGTELTTAVGADGATRIGVDKGTVSVEAEEKKVEVSENLETTVEWGKTPQSPKQYVRSEEQWRKWAEQRQELLVKRAPEMVKAMMDAIRNTRQMLLKQTEEAKNAFQDYRDFVIKQKLEGIKPQINAQHRKEIARRLAAVYILCRRLERLNDRIAATYYLLDRLRQDMTAHPEKYEPETVARMAEVWVELDKLNVPEIVRQDKVILDRYGTALEQATLKFQVFQERKDRYVHNRQEQLKKLREQYQP